MWDTGNGAAGVNIAKVIAKLPGKHILLNEEVDGHFPTHHPDPTVPKNLEQLQQEVVKRGFDLGIAFDGDGDRIGVVDDKGRILWGDQFLVILARDVLKKYPGATIIADVKASQVLFDEVARAGGKPLMWKTGHSLIKTQMAETGSPLAGEMSGHIFFADDWYGFDDALYAGIRLLGVAGPLAQDPGRAARRPARRWSTRRSCASTARTPASSPSSTRCATALKKQNANVSTTSTACASTPRTAGGCCAPPTRRRCWWRAARRATRRGWSGCASN